MSPFEPYFRDIDPVYAIALVLLAGAASLVVLHRFGPFFVIRKGQCARGLATAALLATVFALVVVGADLTFRFPADINVGLPQALWFYPLMATVAESTFHLVPLALLLVVARVVASQEPDVRWFQAGIFAIALIEPAFQLRLADEPGSATGVFTAVQVFAINIVQLTLFRRFDFIAMLGLRLVYYLWWHILWGAARLHVLF